MPHSMRDALLIYGATGYTGELLARAARQEGLAPILCGRSQDKVWQLASELGLEYRVSDLEDPGRLDQALAGVDVVMNAAGPFVHTAPALVDACLRPGAHYLDVTGEVSVVEAVSRRGDEAKRRDVMLMPAAGFDVVASDCLAAHAARRVRSGKRLFIGFSGLRLISRGSALTILEQLGDPVWVRRDGMLGKVPAASIERPFDYGKGPSPSVVVSWADVASAYFTTGVPDISAYFEITPGIRLHNTMVDLFGWALPFTPWRAFVMANTAWMPPGPTDAERATRESIIAVEVEGASGEIARSRLRTPEAYTFTAQAATAITRQVLADNWEPGFQTPARVYGPDFVLTLPGVLREDL